MRRGDFGVEVVAVEGGDVRELESGHVLARPGTVYGIRLRNFGPLRCVTNVRLDGKGVTAAGLVLDAYGVVTLERPDDENETGRFTVVAEGDERVFGPDGGRDNPNLGSIDASFRRELPRDSTDRSGDPVRPLPDIRTLPLPSSPNMPGSPIPPAPGRPMAPPEWAPPAWNASSVNESDMPDISAIVSRSRSVPPPAQRPSSDAIERAAGTGLTGHSKQRFETIMMGPLEQEATTITLRLVIGTDEALAAARPLPREQDHDVPARPAARP
ncbi:MAG TPA: hypothetical protein VK636_09605 [Gemmatimonadaceae bacterium]|nr:hypothetical protein [Gemmatimonadaceae bacterium]